MARILVIEDDDWVRGVVNAALLRDGHVVTEACNGKEGLARYRPETIDLVVTDLIMPEIEGLETIAELKRKFPTIKILAVSGGGRMAPESQLKVASKMGARGVLAKPFSVEALSAAVQQLLAS